MTRKAALELKGLKAARFHEIMDVANLRTGGQVDYNPDATNPYKTGYNRKRSIDGDNMDTQDEVRESVEQFEEQGSRSGSEDSGVSLRPKAPEGESSSKNTVETPQVKVDTPRQTPVEPPQRGDIFMVHTPLTVDNRGRAQVVPAGKQVMVTGLGDEGGTVQVGMEMERNAIRYDVVRGTVNISDLLSHASPGGR